MQKNLFTKKAIGLFLGITAALTACAQEITIKWEVVTPKYATADVFVAALNVMDYGADPSGVKDQTQLFQQLLNKLGVQSNPGTGNGGILFVPEGRYYFQGRLTLPKGVTIRGEWEKPVKGQAVKGTILMATMGKGSQTEAMAFLTLQPSSAVKDLTIWYPNQDYNNIVSYPPAILLGSTGFWGNEYCNVAHVTLVNAYDGIIFSRANGGGAPNCYGIYGSPLKRGIEIDNIAEVGRIDDVDFSADYWAGSGLAGSPAFDGPHKKYIRENATAIVMRRNDWSFIGKAKAEGYQTGYRLDLSFNPDQNGNQTAPNGHNYGMEFTNCRYGVYVNAVSGAGMMFYDYKITDCDFGFYINGNPRGIIQLQGCTISAGNASIYAPATSATKIIVSQCVIDKGSVDLRGGLASILNCDFNNEPDQIILGENARAILTGNRFKEAANIKNVSMYECIIDHTPIDDMTPLPAFPYKNQFDFKQKPTGNAFYLATNQGVSTDADDNSDALQALLDNAKRDGGGLVFLPTGHYKFRKPIVIPTGVELKGSVDTPTLPMGPGTTMEIYAGKDDESGDPFITMEPGSGIRGLVMNYPEQVVQLLTEPERNGGDVYKYPYTIRGNKDVYIVNIAFRASYHGIDLFTNPCDNHYVDYPAGHVFKTGIRVGGGSKDGHIYNAQFNQIAYGSGGESKFGSWPNSPDNTQADQAKYRQEHDLAYAYCWNNLYFLILEDCENEVLYNNFDFGSNRGFILSSKNGKGPSGICLGQGIDQGMNSFYIEGVDDKGFNFINTQIVTTAPGNPDEVVQEYKDNNRYIQVAQAFTGKVTFFGADFWGQPQNISNEILNGTLEMQAGNYDNPGQRVFASVGPDAAFNILGSNINSINSLLSADSDPRFFIQSSFVNARNVNLETCGLWWNNLEQTGSVHPDAGAFIDRTGWIASASVANETANNSIDGDSDTFWGTGAERQKPGQWFQVDMRRENTFNGIYFNVEASRYYPSSYIALISGDGENWTEIASGKNNNPILFSPQQARFIKIEQTGTSTNQWRISEFYVLDSELPSYPTKLNEVKQPDVNIGFADGRLYLSGLTGRSLVRLYDVTGQLVVSPAFMESEMNIRLRSGVYIVVIENNKQVFRKKMLVK
jgi:hypothetical protein